MPPTKSSDLWILHTDGASKGNPGVAGIGIALYKPGNLAEPVAVVAERIPNTTNNVAEYKGLIRGLREALLRGADKIEARTDSELMARQIVGRYKVSSPDIIPLHAEAKTLLARFASANVVHIPRELNAIADKLANQGVASKLESTTSPRKADPPAARPVSTPPPPIPANLPFADKHSRIVNGERLIWNVERLWEAAKDAPVEMLPLSYFDKWLKANCWFDGKEPTIQRVADHAKRIYEADFSHPVILDSEGGLMDGGHRIARAYLEGRKEIASVRLRVMPEPDLRLK